MMGGMEDPAADPLRGMSYREAFNAKRFKKFPALMRRLGCAENVGVENKEPQEERGGDIQEKKETDPLMPKEGIENLKKAYKKEEERFKNASLSQLRQQRRLAIMMKSIDASVQIGMMGLGTVGVYIGDHHSFATELVISSAAVISIYNLKTIIGGVRNLIWTPSNEELDELEIKFATNQCFIPRELWPFIINKFSMARQNPFSQQEAMDVIRFALGLTTFRRTIPISGERSRTCYDQISEKINTFFKKYQDPDPFAIHSLKLGIFKFIEALEGKNEIADIPYIYLHGEPGIGKTHFVGELITWMKEYFNDNIHFYANAIITSPEELEGGPNKPGFLLRVLQSQCLDKKSASFVFFDEASWLNEQPYLSPSKRVFNGEATKLSSTYFGNGTEGKGLDLTIPPMFLIFSANEPIKDEALNTRFEHIQFPKPTSKALEENCKSVFDRYYPKLPLSDNDWDPFQEKFVGEIEEFKNFRRIKKEIPSLMQVYVEEKEDPSRDEPALGSMKVKNPSEESEELDRFRSKETEELLELQRKAALKDPEACFELGKYLYEDELNKTDRSQDIERYQVAYRYLQTAASERSRKAKEYLDKVNGDFRSTSNVGEKIDAFFNGYQDPDPFAIYSLKSGIFKFIQALKTRNRKLIGDVPFIYLHGESGIGKTHFVEELKKWIQDFGHFKRIVHFEDAIIKSPEDLEGGEKKPGLLVRVLRNQRLNKKSASFVFFDDASWLNEQPYLNSSKRVFNGKSVNLSSSYLGNGTEEKGQDLAIPPMFLIFCAKTPIEDETLSSCFEHVQFPHPKPELFLDYSKQIFSEQGHKAHLSADTDWNPFQEKFREEIKKFKNSRRVRKELPPLMKAYAGSSRTTRNVDDSE